MNISTTRPLVADLAPPPGHRLPTVQLPVELFWTGSDPLAVQLRFVTAGAVWEVGRELLAEGLAGPAGCGDITLRPAGRALDVQISSPDGHASVQVPAREVRSFLAEIRQAMSDDEIAAVVDAALDAAIDMVLSEAPGGAAT